MNIKSVLAFLLLFALSCNKAQPSKFDHTKFDELLRMYVDENGMVNYDGFKDNRKFSEYLKSIELARVETLSNEERLAFYINAYNATVIKNVIDHLPINSPMEVKGFFKEIKHKIAGKELTLDELEHKYTLKIEPTLSHFGLVCAAKSCPKLINKAYDSKTVIFQLEENARIYLNDTHKNKLDKQTKILYLSEIFKWFKDSFINKYGSLLETAIRFMDKEDAEYLQKNEVTLKYMKYNWQLNKQ